MLNLLRKSWVTTIAVVLCLAYGGLSFALSLEHQDYYHEANYSAGSQAQVESVQDRSAEVVAEYTKVLAYFTGVLAVLGILQGGLIGWQGSLARSEFIATHRPKLKVRSMQTDGLGGAAFLTVANIGESNATITGIIGIFGLRNRAGKWLNGRPDISNERQPPEEYRHFKTGQRHTFLLSMNQPDPEEIIAIGNGEEILVAVGTICYADDNGIERRTGFCWPYNPATVEFIDPEETTEYNYED